ncbi:hypothetical protein LXL04_000388 [Taraxacum kok-saghyz]
MFSVRRYASAPNGLSLAGFPVAQIYCGNINVGISKNDNHDVSTKNSLNICDNGASYWSDLNLDVLLLVMMQLGVFDFVSFSGVCKSWKSFAFSNMWNFMASRPTIYVRMSTYIGEKKSYLLLEDLEGIKSKNSVPFYANYPFCSSNNAYIGSTCGYIILYLHRTKSRDFWLVNPITRHKLQFPNSPFSYSVPIPKVTSAIVVFSCSISKWVFVISVDYGSPNMLFFSIAGQGKWEHVSSSFSIIDLEAFSGRIYTLNKACHLCELILDPQPKLMLLETKKIPIFSRCQKLVSSCKNLYLREYLSDGSYEFHKLNFDEMNWVSCGKESEECAFIHSTLKDLEEPAPPQRLQRRDKVKQANKFANLELRRKHAAYLEEQRDAERAKREREQEILKQQEILHNLSILGTKTEGLADTDVAMVEELKAKA